MAYNIRTYKEFREGKLGSEMQDYTLNSGAFSIDIVGNGYEDFAQVFSENMLWICSNFYDSTPPLNPIVGQTWFDTSSATLNVYGIDNTWNEVTSGLIDTSNINENIIPTSTDTYSFGNTSNMYNEGHVGNIYAETLTYYNIYSDKQNVVVSEGSNSSLQYQSNLYPSSLELLSTSEDIDQLITTADANEIQPWTTVKSTLTISNSVSSAYIPQLVDRQVAIYDIVGQRDGNFTIIINGEPPTTDTQILIRILEDPDGAVGLSLPSGVNYNYINNFTGIIPPFTPVRISFLQTENDYEFDVIMTEG